MSKSRTLAGLAMASRIRIFDEVLSVAKAEIVIPLAGYSKFEIDADILIAAAAGDAALAWQVSYDGGSTYLNGSAAYTYEFLRGYGNTAAASNGQLTQGFMCQTWNASAPGVPAGSFGRFFKGDASRVPTMRATYGVYAAGVGEEAGEIFSRATSTSGVAATHLKIKVSTGAAALGIGSRITVEAKQ